MKKRLKERGRPLTGRPFFLPPGYKLSRAGGDPSTPFQRGFRAASFTNPEPTKSKLNHLYTICVARHPFIAEHFARFFSEVGVDTAAAVGLQGAVALAGRRAPDVVVCEYELLAMLPLDAWECDEVLRRTPVVAVSLTRRSDEVNPLDSNGIAGFLYLPTLTQNDARRLLYAAATRPTYTPGGTSLSSLPSASDAG